MADLDTFFVCTLGGLWFQLVNYSVADEPVFMEVGGTRIVMGRRIKVSGRGFVDAPDATSLAARLAVARGMFRSSGETFTVSGLGGALEYSLTAAECVEGGPHASFEQLEQAGALRKEFAFTLEGTTSSVAPDETNGGVSEARSEQVTTRPDGIVLVIVSGEMIGPDTLARFSGVTLAELRARFPWPSWVLSHRAEVSGTGDRLSYAVQVEQTTEALPAAGGTLAVDGTASTSTSFDSGGRKLTVYSFDLMVTGDPEQLYTLLRPPAPAVIVAESKEVTRFKEVRLRASFSVLSGLDAAHPELLEWSAEVEASRQDSTARGFEYDGVRATLAIDPAGSKLHAVSISGRAVGMLRYPKPPSPGVLAGGFRLAELPRVRRSRRNEVERETSWLYTYVGAAAMSDEVYSALLRDLQRPPTPEFYP